MSILPKNAAAIIQGHIYPYLESEHRSMAAYIAADIVRKLVDGEENPTLGTIKKETFQEVAKRKLPDFIKRSDEAIKGLPKVSIPKDI